MSDVADALDRSIVAVRSGPVDSTIGPVDPATGEVLRRLHGRYAVWREHPDMPSDDDPARVQGVIVGESFTTGDEPVAYVRLVRSWQRALRWHVAPLDRLEVREVDLTAVAAVVRTGARTIGAGGGRGSTRITRDEWQVLADLASLRSAGR